MFTQILAWLARHVPGFLRPALNWLLDAFRRITNYISSRWNWLGVSVGQFMSATQYFSGRIVFFAAIVANAIKFLRDTWVPGFVSSMVTATRRALEFVVSRVDKALRALISTLERWARQALGVLGRLLNGVKRFGEYWIGQIRNTITGLLRVLAPFLGGPQRLAEWLIGALFKAAWKYVVAQRNRIFQWALRSSTAFTVWLAREVETLLVRLL